MKEASNKVISLVLAFALVFGLFPSAVLAAEEESGVQDSGAPPTLSIGVSSVTDSGATLEFTADQDGTVYYLVQEAAKPEPEDADAIRAAQSAAVSAATPTDVAYEGLLANTAYVVYGIAESEGLESDIVSQAFTTEKSLPAAHGRTTPQAIGFRSSPMSGGLSLSTDPATGPLITSASTDIYVLIPAPIDHVWLRFIPTDTATYTIATTGSNPLMSTEAWLYDNLSDAVNDITGDGSLAIAQDAQFIPGEYFSITHPLTAGTVYYLWASSTGDSNTVPLSITGGGLYGGPVVSGALGKTFTEDDSATVIAAAEMSATDDFDDASDITYTLTSVPTKGTLAMDGIPLAVSGTFTQADVAGNKVTYTPTANANGPDSFGFTVSAPTVGLSTGTKTFLIAITAVNDVPVLSVNTGFTLDEDAPETTITNAMLKAEDVDGDTLTYTIGTAPNRGTLKNNAAALSAGGTFTQADIDSGNISYTPSSNVYGEDSFAFTVSDGHGGSIGSTAFAITITAVNDAPVITTNTGLSLNEDAPETTITSAMLAATDAEGDPLTYTMGTAPTKGVLKKDGAALTSGGTFAPADITGNKITYTPAADANGADSFTFTVSDGNGGTVNGTFSITIAPVNDAPTDIALSSTNISEAAASESVVGTLSTTDVDAGDTFTYSLVSGTGSDDNSSFVIAGDKLKTAATFDYALKNSYSIRIKSDDGYASVEKAFTIHITEENKAPTNISLTSTSVPENVSAGTAVGTLSTTDPNAGDTSFTYILKDTGDYASFTIDGNSLKLAASPDYETKSSYTITIRSTDAGGLFFEKGFTVNVIAVNEAPTDIMLTASTVAENSPVGTVVGTLTGTDPDTGDSVTLSLPAGLSDNASFAIAGNQLQLAFVPDFETKSSYTVTVRATDQGNLTFDQQFTITVTNVNEAPTDITLSNNSVSEAAARGSVVGMLSADDADGGDALTYALAGGAGDADNSLFAISGNTLATNATFSYATKNSYSIRVKATDSGGLYMEKVFTINITETAPTVTGVTTPKANGTYGAGEIFIINVTFSKPVMVTGEPRLTLETGTTDRAAVYAGGTGTDTLAFTYTVQPGDTSGGLDYTSSGALTLNGGTIKTAGGTDAVLTLPEPGAHGSLAANKIIVIDAIAPTVSSVSVPAAGTYKAGDLLSFGVSFSKDVGVVSTSGIPRLALTIGSTTRYADYGSGSSTLIFNYTIQSGDFDSDGITVVSLSADGSTIRDIIGNNAALTLNGIGSTSGVLVDAVAPTATITIGETALAAGESCLVTFTFSEPVTGFANDDLTIANGSLTPVTSTDGGTTYTATFTADSVNAAVNTITVDLTGVSDSAGNAGVGTASSANYSIRIITAPGAPTGVTATAGNGQATVRFTPPASDGGETITSYTVTSNPGGISATGTTSPITVTGLSNGTAYTFTVTATNKAGTGAESAVSNSVTPQASWNGGGGDARGPRGPSAPTTPIVPEKKPDQPVTAAAPVAATAGANGSANANIPEKAITDAIAKAQADAKAQGKAANGISVALNVTMPQVASALTATLPRSSLDSLVSAGVTSLTINGSPVTVSFDQKTLQEIQKQSTGNISITIVPNTNLSASAKAMIGTRPVYDLSVSYGKDGKNNTLSGFGGGTATVSVPYTPGQNEAVGGLYAVYVDAKGNATRIAGSVYDANSGCVIFTTTHFSVYGLGYTAPSAKFTDIGTHWGKESIDYVVGRGLLSGTSAATFSPNTAMTRGMLVTALGRLAGVDTKGYTGSSFTDVKADSAFGPYSEWADKKGVVQSIGNGQFAPDRAVTREEIAVIMGNYAKATGYTLPVTREAAAYADASSIGSVYRTAVTAMQQAGIMMGGSGNRFNPKASATRAEVAAMLHRYIKLTIDPATAQGWALNDAGQWLYYKDGKPLTGTQTIDGVNYFFETTGVRYYSGNQALAGWVKDGLRVSGKWLWILLLS